MPSFKIKGGKPLKGVVSTLYSKNAALAIFAASLMTKDKTVLNNVPNIQEVYRFEEIFKSIGVGWQWLGEHKLEITPPAKLKLDKINYAAAAKTRSIIYLLGALLHDYKHIKLPRSGGCKLGKRTIAPHIYALEEYGAHITVTKKYFELKIKGRAKGRYFVMYESGDTTTNNAIMAAVLAEGTTTIKMASANYMVQDLCHFLNKMGANIKGIGSTTLEIKGVEKLRGIEYNIMHDPIVSMFWLSLAATTNSELTIKSCPRDFIELELLKLKKMNYKFEVSKPYRNKNGNFDLIDIKTKKSKMVALPEKIYARPFPGLNIDNLPFFATIAAVAKGRTLIHDWTYENRAIYLTELQKLGANVMLLDPFRVIIEGPTKWQSNELVCPPALRPATVLIIAMLAAKGTSIIRNTYPIDRGYENLYQSLIEIGADIEEIL